MIRLAIAGLLVVAVVGCAGTAAPSPTPKPLATITITSPAAGATVAAGDVAITYDVSDVALVPAASAQKLEDYHVHAILDIDAGQYVGKDLPVPAGDANPKPDRIIHTAAKTVTFKNVPAGEHTVTVFMSFSSHVSVKPAVMATVKFTAK